jgi:hypothetical protein
MTTNEVLLEVEGASSLNAMTHIHSRVIQQYPYHPISISYLTGSLGETREETNTELNILVFEKYGLTLEKLQKIYDNRYNPVSELMNLKL